MRTMGREEEGEKEEKWKINAPRATRCTAEPCNAFNFPHKFICPSPLSHSFRISRAFFLPFHSLSDRMQTNFRQETLFLTLSTIPISPSFCLSLDHLSEPLRLSYPTVCNTFYRPSSFVLTPFRINLWFLELLESYWKVLRMIGVKINIIG